MTLVHIPKDARKGKEPCGECHIKMGETCDICGAKHGNSLTREHLSLLVYEAVDRFDAARSHKGAMHLAGELKAIAMAAAVDDYWSEKVNAGFRSSEWQLRQAANQAPV